MRKILLLLVVIVSAGLTVAPFSFAQDEGGAEEGGFDVGYPSGEGTGSETDDEIYGGGSLGIEGDSGIVEGGEESGIVEGGGMEEDEDDSGIVEGGGME
ncbi:MAG: hypothetical protein KKD29_04160 [Candidatus Omnitrophica bacterium]|nr:hypothetical protein [Candidatus Omnitrophota bacterium]MBU4488522.1 hypothetical protein [Candidatus Omnitrophota bacterium]MCG2704566.1 hypothetical protein [Candidatus Omnitrophota bacterium]